ncbi:MAG: ATP-binding protein, partial [Lachnospiraceae bacterium]|nr:ATP-binding protein [Lachnospiraceae bacterium]
MRELKTDATLDQLDEVLAFVDEELEKNCEDERIIIQLNIAVEELFVNIAHYAYQPNVGWAVIRTDITENPKMISITFIDAG